MPELTAPLPELKPTSVSIIRSVMEIAVTNRVAIDEKKAKASAVIKAVRDKLKVIDTVAQDQYVENLIVISRNTAGEMEKLRKEYTAKVNAWLKDEIAPENELKAEIQALVDMRNARAKQIADKAAQESARIQAEKDKSTYEIEVKRALKASVEKGLYDRIVALDNSLADWFVKNIRPETAAGMEKSLKGMSPKLKEDIYLSWFMVDTDSARMSIEEYNALVARAKAHYTYETINEKYVGEAKPIIQKWVEKIPSRVKELELIAKGGDQGERVKKIAEEREANERQEAAKAVEDKLTASVQKINEEAQGEQMSAEFKAQAQEQKVEQPTGTREQKFFVLDAPGNTLQVSKIVGSIIIHMIPHKSAEDKIKMILKHDKNGKPALDKDGDPVYTDGVQFWLDQVAGLGYDPKIEGLTLKRKISTVAKTK